MRGLSCALFLGLGLATVARASEPALSEEVVEHVREIRAVDETRRDDAFSKMGGSSVQSKAFLHCFASPHVDLGEHLELAETIDFFGTGRRSSFARQSEAAGVSWNLRYVLGGRPASFREELRATEARWALVLFGGNDAQNQNERIYLKRLVYLVEELEQMGVVPVLGSAAPRRGATRNRWIRRFNAITEAVAHHWELPYVDYYGALDGLPRKGLARDGVHPNVLPPGGLKHACDLTERGLRYGNNVRNLLTLQMLDQLRRQALTPDPGTVPDTVTATVPVTTPVSATVVGPVAAGRDPDPGRIPGRIPGRGSDPGPNLAVPDGLSEPLSFLLDKPALPPASPLPERCGVPKPESRQHRTSLTLPERTRIRAVALDLDTSRKPRIFLVRIDDQGPRCVRRRLQNLEADVPAGMWQLIVEVEESAAEDGRMLVVIMHDPR